MELSAYINEVWPQVNKWAIKMDKEALESAREKVKARHDAKVIPAKKIPVGYIY